MTFPSARRARVLLIAFAAFLCAIPASGSAGPGESWMGIFFNGKKIGYSDTRIEPAMYRGKPAYRVVSKTVTRLELMGNRVSQDILLTGYTDRKYAPIRQDYVIASNGSRLELTADYSPRKIRCVVRTGAVGESGQTSPAAKPTIREVTVPPGAQIVSDSSESTLGKSMTPGQKQTYYYLNPLTIALEKMDVVLIGREKVTLAGIPYDSYRISATTPYGTLVSWITAGGDLLKGEMPLGMALFRQTREAALNMASAMPTFEIAGTGAAASAYQPPADFAVATAIATDKPIENPRELGSLTLTVSGIDDKKLIISDARQRAEPAADGAYRLRIDAARFDAADSVQLPIADPSVAAYLKSAPYLDSADPRIQSIAAKLRGGESNAYRVAQAIRAWVHSTMRPDYTIGVPRASTDILSRPKGVCRDYATLYAGVARAAGIPTRVVGGIVYAEGKFYYHAWDEIWVGQWVPMDATLPGDFVDATHVKFAQGDVTDMFNVGAVIGRIGLKVDSAG